MSRGQRRRNQSRVEMIKVKSGAVDDDAPE